jgi:F-type H+-transporting ATPase subunit delta
MSAHPYAQALLEVEHSQSAESFQGDLDTLAGLIATTDVQTFLTHPDVATAEREHWLASQFKGRVPETVFRLMEALLAHKRLHQLPIVAQAYRTLKQKHAGVLPVEVTTVVGLNPDQQAQLERTLSEITGFPHIALQHAVDPGILGGIVLRIQDLVLDASFQGRLEQLEKQLIG